MTNLKILLTQNIDKAKSSDPVVTAMVLIAITIVCGLIIWRRLKRRKAMKAEGCPSCIDCPVKNCPSKMSDNDTKKE